MNYLKKIPPMTIALTVALLSTLILFILLILLLRYNSGIDARMIYSLSVILGIVNTVVVVLAFTATIRKKTRYYISFSYKDFIALERITFKLLEKAGAEVVSYDRFPAGLPIKEAVKDGISSSSVCLVLIGSGIPETQKQEIKEMKDQKKRIIPILLTEDSVLPTSLKNYKAMNPDEFERLIDENKL